MQPATVTEKAEDLAEAVKAKVTTEAQETVDDTKEAISNTNKNIQEQAQAVKEKVVEGASKTMDDAKEVIVNSNSNVQEQAASVRDSAAEAMKDFTATVNEKMK